MRVNDNGEFVSTSGNGQTMEQYILMYGYAKDNDLTKGNAYIKNITGNANRLGSSASGNFGWRSLCYFRCV